MSYKRDIFMIGLFGIALAYFLGLFSDSSFKPFSLKLGNVKEAIDLDLPCKDAYLLAIWNPNLPKAVYFNGKQVVATRISKRKDYTSYFVLPQDEVREGSNNLRIIGPGEYSVKIRNYVAASKFGNVYVLNKASRFISRNKFDLGSLFVNALLLCLVLTICWLIMASIDPSIRSCYFISFIPCVLFFIIFILVESFTQYRILISRLSFIGLNFILVNLVFFPLVFFKFSKKFRGGGAGKDNFLARAFSLILDDPANIFFVMFIFLLTLSVFSMVFKLDIISEIIINIGYIVLLAGAGMKLYKRLRNRIDRQINKYFKRGSSLIG